MPLSYGDATFGFGDEAVRHLAKKAAPMSRSGAAMGTADGRTGYRPLGPGGKFAEGMSRRLTVESPVGHGHAG